MHPLLHHKKNEKQISENECKDKRKKKHFQKIMETDKGKPLEIWNKYLRSLIKEIIK